MSYPLDQRIAANSGDTLTTPIVIDNHNDDMIEESSTVTHCMVKVRISNTAIIWVITTLVSSEVNVSAAAVDNSSTITNDTITQPVVAVVSIDDMPMRVTTEETLNKPQGWCNVRRPNIISKRGGCKGFDSLHSMHYP